MGKNQQLFLQIIQIVRLEYLFAYKSNYRSRQLFCKSFANCGCGQQSVPPGNLFADFANYSYKNCIVKCQSGFILQTVFISFRS